MSARVNKFTRTKHFLLRIVLWDKKEMESIWVLSSSYFGVYSNNAVLKQGPNFNVKKIKYLPNIQARLALEVCS